MKNPKEIKCPECKELRLIDYRDLWAIKKGIHTARCYRCSRPKPGEVNSGCFKKGQQFSEEFRLKMSLASKGKKKSKRTAEHSRNLGLANKGKNLGDKNSMKRIEVRRKVSEAQRGEKNHSWKGGKLNIKKAIRDSLEYKIWRTEVFKRDSFACILCKKGKQIEADHYPKMFSSILYENNINSFDDALKCKNFWDIKNGRTLCRECHEKTDTFGWRGAKIIRQSVNGKDIRLPI